MIITPRLTQSPEGQEILDSLLQRFQDTDSSCQDLVADILANVRMNKNSAVIDGFVQASDWIENLAKVDETRSNTSVCLSIVDEQVANLDASEQATFAKGMVQLLDAEGVALDIGSYRDAPPGLRIWAGGTVEASDLEALMPWLTWAFQTQLAELSAEKAA